MNIINISQSIVSKIRSKSSADNTIKTDERRVHADRRKEQRFGDVNDRRK